MQKRSSILRKTLSQAFESLCLTHTLQCLRLPSGRIDTQCAEDLRVRRQLLFQTDMVTDGDDMSGDTNGSSTHWRPVITNAGSGAFSSARLHHREDERDRWRVFGYDLHQQRGLRKPHCHKSSHKIQASIQQQRCALLSPWPRRILTYVAPR